MRKIGFFGGTFDPIHLGHIALALAILEERKLDEILFSPAFVSPQKTQTPPLATQQQRLEMTSLAIAGIDSFTLYSKEIERGGHSFTIDTIKALIQHDEERGEHNEYHLILGSRVLDTLHRWKEIEALVTLAPPYVGCRQEEGGELAVTLSPTTINLIENGRTEVPLFDISSTAIRERIKNKLYCGHLLKREVLDFIYKNELYLK